MKIFIAHFSSMWLGGHAVILAENEVLALEILNKRHHKKLSENEVTFIQHTQKDGAIVYYDNGDY